MFQNIEEMFSDNINEAQRFGYNFCMKYLKLMHDLGLNVKLVKLEE